MVNKVNSLFDNSMPQHWKLENLGEVLRFVGSGITPKGGKSVYKDSGIPFIRSQNVYPNELKLDDIAFIDEATHTSMSRSIVLEHDVLLNITGASIGRCTFVPSGFGEANVNQHVCILRSDDTRLNYQYLTAFMNSSLGQQQVFGEQAGQTREGLNYQQIRQFVIPVPSLPEQRKIAAILTSVDDAITATQSIIDQTEVVKRGLMQQLLTKGIGHTKFKQTEIGEIPAEWEVKALEQVGTWSGGGTPSKSKLNYWTSSSDGILWVSPKDIDEIIIADSQDKITEAGRSEKGLSLLPVGTILFVTRSGILRKRVPISLTGKKLTINQDLKSLKVNQGLNHKYVFFVLKAFEEKIRLSCVKSGTTVESIDFPTLKSFQIPIPSRHEQDKIALIAEEFYKKQVNEKGYMHELSTLKQGLMQVLLTGKVRVNVDEPSEVSV